VQLSERFSAWLQATVLVDRREERRTLDMLVQSLRAGESRALVISGEPGIGKTALLDYLSHNAAGCRVERVAGFQSEMELPFAAVQQLCGPLHGPDRAAGPAAQAEPDQPP
jgi:predicted ATPase